MPSAPFNACLRLQTLGITVSGHSTANQEIFSMPRQLPTFRLRIGGGAGIPGSDGDLPISLHFSRLIYPGFHTSCFALLNLCRHAPNNKTCTKYMCGVECGDFCTVCTRVRVRVHTVTRKGYFSVEVRLRGTPC